MPRIQNIHQPAELKNYAINGALDFWQEKTSTTTTVNTATTTSGYSADMVQVVSVGATTKNYSYVRSTDVPTVSQAGFQAPYSHLFTMITGIPSLAATDSILPFQYRMEGQDYAKLHSKVVTFGFWMKASIAGTYSFALQNGAGNRCYVTTFSINNANTWEFKAITVQLDSSGSWNFDNTVGLQVNIASTSGSNNSTSTLNQWQSGGFYASTTNTNWTGTSGATMRIGLLSIVEGSLGIGSLGFQRAGKTIQQELSMCQRYLFRISNTVNGNAAWDGVVVGTGYNVAADNMRTVIHMPVALRGAPSVTVSAASDFRVIYAGTNSAVATTVVINPIDSNYTQFQFFAVCASVLTTGSASMLMFVNGNNGYILVDARL